MVVVGAGFAGMYATYQFRKLGLNIKVLEAGTDVGGTWYWNRYPGARCDVPSLEYSFGFSKELQQEWDWPEVFSAQPDILAYANHIADRFDLRSSMQFNTRVVDITYIEQAAELAPELAPEQKSHWQLQTADGEIFTAKFCVMASGCLSVPNKPNIPGADSFSGQVFHTGLWPKEDVDLAGLRVGIVGTGSSGVQAIPELAKQAGHLTVFQRTPVYTMPANRKRMRTEVQDEYRQNHNLIRKLQQENAGGVSNFRPSRSIAKAPANTNKPTSSLIADPSERIRPYRNNLLKPLDEAERVARIKAKGPGELLNFRDVYTDPEANEIANELFRDFVRETVEDPSVAEKLIPTTYGIGCKRQVLDRDYYETFNRDDVTLVDVKANPITSIDQTGINADQHYELDVLIYATGFDAMTGALTKANITGPNNLSLREKWQYGPAAYLGLQMHGFPNLFTVTGPGSPSVLCNMLVAIEQHVNWIGDCINYMNNNKKNSIQPTPESESEWVAHVNEVAEGTMYTSESCNSWYLGANIPGKPRIFMPYVGGYPRYKAQCDWETDNQYKGFSIQ